MHINDIPVVILVWVFDRYCESTTDTTSFKCQFDTWKPRLELLKVCRVWRELALPVVHRESFITFIHNSRDSGASDISESGDSDSQDPNQSNGEDAWIDKDVIKSSLDLIGNINIKYRPRALQIYSDKIYAPAVVFRAIMQKIRTYNQILDRVQTVKIMIYRDGVALDNPTGLAEASALGKEFCKTIPSVQHLHFGPIYSISAVLGVCKSLVSGYAHKLKSIASPHWALENADRFFPDLRYIDIESIMDGVHMPKICADSLDVLMLNKLGNMLVWSSFEKENDPETLWFSNLKTLRLGVNVGHRDDDEGNDALLYPALEFRYKIFAPMLQNVNIRVCPHTLSILSSIQGLSVIKCATFSMCNATISATGLNLEKARSLFSSYARGDIENYEAVDTVSYMNDIFSIEGLTERASVLCWSILNTQEIERINWKYLDDLKINSRLKLADLPSLLSRVPSLAIIRLGELELESHNGSIAEILGPKEVVEPIESMIKQVSVCINPSWTEADVNNLKVYLSKLLPNITVTTEE